LLLLFFKQAAGGQDNQTNDQEDPNATDKFPVFIASSSDNENENSRATISPQLLHQIQEHPEQISVSVLNETREPEGLTQDGTEQKSVRVPTVLVNRQLRLLPKNGTFEPCNQIHQGKKQLFIYMKRPWRSHFVKKLGLYRRL